MAKREITEIRARRRELGLTQQDLEARTGIRQTVISKIERGLLSANGSRGLRIRRALFEAERDAGRIAIPDIGISLSDLLAMYRETEAAR
jgi:predicted transcriptional regulator